MLGPLYLSNRAEAALDKSREGLSCVLLGHKDSTNFQGSATAVRQNVRRVALALTALSANALGLLLYRRYYRPTRPRRFSWWRRACTPFRALLGS